MLGTTATAAAVINLLHPVLYRLPRQPHHLKSSHAATTTTASSSESANYNLSRAFAPETSGVAFQAFEARSLALLLQSRKMQVSALCVGVSLSPLSVYKENNGLGHTFSF